jgi:pimeloyl-ACP methyl ester carboxylesterase
MVAAGLSYRESGPADSPVALMLHGFPESSFMWRDAMPAVADAGWRAVAPDFAGYGDSQPDPPGTWERHIESVERFRSELGIETCVLVVHDWGGLVGLRWACEHPDAVRALVISSTGFFPNGKWHGMAKALREPGTGEQLIAGIDRDGLAAVMRGSSSGMTDEAIAEYWKGYADETRRRGQLELYRSGDFSKLEGYDLAALGVPTLLLWGEDDEFAPVAGAHRFQRELSDTELVVVEGTRHFVWEDAPAECAAALTGFLSRVVER